MIRSGRCHGPGCQQAARVEYWCGEVCQARWNAALTMPKPGHHPGGWVDPPAGTLTPLAEVDLVPFQEAMSRTVRLLAEVTQLPGDLLGNDDSDTPERPDRTIAVAWGQPGGARPPFSPAAAALGAGALSAGVRSAVARAAEAERLTLHIRAVCRPDQLDEAMAKVDQRVHDMGMSRVEALQAVFDDLSHGRSPSAGAAYALVAPEDLQVSQSGMRGWLGRWIHRKRRTR